MMPLDTDVFCEGGAVRFATTSAGGGGVNADVIEQIDVIVERLRSNIEALYGRGRGCSLAVEACRVATERSISKRLPNCA